MAKKKEVVITCNATNVKAVIEGLERGMAALAKEEENLLNTIKQRGYAENDEKKRLKELEKAMDAMRTNVQKNREEQKKLAEVMKDLSGAKLKDLKKALQEGKAALNNMSARDPGREKLVSDLKKIQAQIEANTGAIKKNQSAWGALGTTMKNLFAYAGIFAGFNLLKSKMTEAYEANKRFSDSMANVRKVSGLTMDEIGKLANNLSKIDSRTGLGGLMELGYTGAKLGFGNYGIEGLESFAKSAVKVQNALSEDMGADAMTALSKMVEVMGLIPKMGVERAMDATGSAIFKLASTSTATGTNIVEFSKRLMGLANIAHISTADLLAFGSAADSMALMPEVAATAFNKLISAVQKQPNLIENALNIPKGTISDLYQAGHMTEALVTIFEKMREKGGMNALMQSGVFKDLGSDGARLVAVMATMANRVDMLNAHLAVSRQAFEEGTAVAQEYAIQMDTAAAYSERAANIWEKAFVNPEGVDTVKEFTKAWYEVSKALTSNKVAMAEVKFLLGGILELLKSILYFLPALLSGLAVLGAGRMFVALRSSLELTRLSAVGLTLSLNGLKTAWTALSAVGKANWIGAAATALFMIIEAFGMFNKKVQEATGYMKGFKKNLDDLNVEYGKAEAELRRYRRAIDEANTGSKQRLAAINTFNNKFKPYLSNLLTEKSTALDVAKAYNEVTKAIRAKLALQLKEKDIEKYVAPREQWAAQRRQEYEKRANEAGKGQYGSTWITGYAQDNRNKTIDAMVRDIGKQYYNLPQQIIDEVSVQAAAGNTSFNNYGNIINSRYLKDANALLAASSYLRQERSTENALRRTNKKWEPEQKLMDELTAQQDETPYEPLQDAPDKEAERAAKKAAQERKQALRKEMEDAQKASTGIISKLEEYYRLQEAAINDARADGQLTEEQAKEMVRALSIVKNESLATARRAVTTGDTKDWDELKTKVLPAVMSDTSEVSRNLLSTIQQVAVDKLHTDLEKFNGSSDVLGLDSRAFFDQMNAKAAGNTREAARLRAKIQNEVERALMQYQFVEKANQQMRKDVETMGITTETYEQWAERMQQGIEEKPDTRVAMGQNARDEILQQFKWDWEQRMQQPARTFNGEWNPASFPFNSDNEEQVQEWFRQFATNAKWASGIPKLQEWLEDGEKYKAEIRKFYESLILIQESAMQKSESVSPLAPVDETWMKRGQQGLDDLFSYTISDEQAYRQMGNKFIEQGVINFRYNIDNEEEARQWVKQFATDARGDLEGWAQAFPDLVAWIDLIKRKEQGETLGEAELQALEEAMPRIQNLYNEMLNHADRVNKAMKDAFQHEKEQQESRFRIAGYTDQENQTDKFYANKNKQEETGAGQTFVQQLGLGSIANDPEVLQIQNRIYWRNQELEDASKRLDAMKAMQDEEIANLRATAASKEEIAAMEQQHAQDRAGLEQLVADRQTALFEQTNNLVTKTMQLMQKRAQSINTLTKPIQDGAKNIGQKFGEMIRGVEEDSMTWNEIWRSMAQAVGDSIVDMMAQYAQNMIMEKMMNQQSKQEAISKASVDVAAGTASAAAKTVGTLGWWGLALIPVIAAVLHGLLAAAFASNKQSDTSKSSSATKLKLVSGMLTYDSGNLQEVVGEGRSTSGRLLPTGRKNVGTYLGQDGQVYRAREDAAPKTGLITKPIATTVQGQPALVAERGPEIVIGRKTTKRIQMAAPELLHAIQLIDRGYTPRRLYDEGNVAALPATVPVASPAGQQSDQDARMADTLAALTETVAVLSATVTQLQQKGIPAHINKYGSGGLIEEVKSGLKFDARYNK